MNAYGIAHDTYAEFGVDTESVMRRLAAIPLSLHCWQGDDAGGFERKGGEIGGGLAITGSYFGKARTIGELRKDFEKVLALVPGRHRISIHASYADFSGRGVDRDELTIAEFQSWIDWARSLSLGVDFNPTFFGHLLAASGFTLAHTDPGIRGFWIRHGEACRRISAEIGRQLGSAVVTNFWIPDGYKDTPYDRAGPRRRLETALNAIFAEAIDLRFNLDALESKLFGLGCEAYVVGSHEFYMGYAVTRRKLVCLDAGHFHPTETLTDKISSVLQFTPELLLHLSRGVRWDSDHVVTLDDNVRGVAEELVRGEFLERTHLGLDFFDASINRIAAWAIGARSTLKALLIALLEPAALLRAAENTGDYTSRLSLLEALKTLPFGAVWDEHCRRHSAPPDLECLREIKAYESAVLSCRV